MGCTASPQARRHVGVDLGTLGTSDELNCAFTLIGVRDFRGAVADQMLGSKLMGMKISHEELEAFIQAYNCANGERLTREEALDATTRILAFVKLLSKSSRVPPSNEKVATAAS